MSLENACVINNKENAVLAAIVRKLIGSSLNVKLFFLNCLKRISLNYSKEYLGSGPANVRKEENHRGKNSV